MSQIKERMVFFRDFQILFDKNSKNYNEEYNFLILIYNKINFLLIINNNNFKKYISLGSKQIIQPTIIDYLTKN